MGEGEARDAEIIERVGRAAELTALEAWRADGVRRGWQMPRATWWQRLPFVRRLRAIYYLSQIDRHQAMFSAMGLVPSGYDQWVIWGMVNGQERPLRGRG